MHNRIALVSSDGALPNSLRSQVKTCQDCEFDLARTPEEATAVLNSAESRFVIVDSRARSQAVGLSDVLTEIEQGKFGHLECLSLSDGLYPVELAALLDRNSAEHFDFPLSKTEAGHLSQRLAQPRRTNGYNWSNSPKQLDAGDISYFTYDDATGPVLDLVERVAKHDATLMLIGETGTGKSTLAQIIHLLSGRADQEFQNVACGALPSDLIESELFGHVRGAFTGADRDKMGRFEAAGNGTLLLDEIDVLGPNEQVKLLRVIETGEFERVGSTATREANARLIVASNVDLDTLTRKGHFRSDLYYRLNVLQFRLPPLRERVCDIVPLAMHFVNEYRRQTGIRVDYVDRLFLNGLKSYRWPGNIRELKNHMQRAVLLCEDGTLRVEDLSPEVLVGDGDGVGPESAQNGRSLAERIADYERGLIEEELKRHDMSRTETAVALGISRVGLYKKMKKYGLL